MLITSFQAANLAERAGTHSPAALGIIGLAAASLGLGNVADRYFDRARQGEQNATDITPYVHLIHLEACHLVGQGRVEDADGRCEEGIAMSREAGYRTGIASTKNVQSNLRACAGRFEEMHPLTESAWEIIQEEPAFELRYYILLGHLHADSWLLSPSEACVSLEAIRARMDKDTRPQALQTPITACFAAKILAMAGRLAEATDEAESSLKGLLKNVRLVSPILWFTFDGALETYTRATAAWKSDRPNDAAAALRRAERVLKGLQAYSKLYPIGWSRFFYFGGRIETLKGHLDKARDSFKTSLEWAEKLKLPIDAALARVELARITPRESPDRKTLLQSALAAFQKSKVPRLIDEIDMLS